MFIEKMYCIGSENSWLNNFCLKFLYLGFILFLHFSIYTVSLKNIQWSKQPRYNWSCLCIFYCIFVTFGKIDRCLFQADYFLIYRLKFLRGRRWKKHFQWCSRLKTLFLLQIKIRLKSGCPIKEYNAIFKHIHQIIKAHSRSKKESALINDIGKIRTRGGVSEQFWFFSNTAGRGRSKGSRNWRQILQFYSHVRLVRVVPALNLTQNCYINMSISFSWNLAILS